MTRGLVIARNAIAQLASMPLSWALTLVFMVLVPRSIGATEFGEWSIGWSVCLVARSLLDLGVNTVLIKDVARDLSRAEDYIGAALAVRLLLVGPLALGVVGFSFLAGYSAHTRLILVLVLAAVLVAFVGSPAITGLQALQKLHVPAIASVVENLVLTGSAVLLVKFLALGIISIAVVAVCAATARVAVQWLWLARYVRPQFRADWKLAQHLLVAGLPYWFSALFLSIYVWIDGILLSVLTSPQEVGWYGAATQLIATLGFLPASVTMAVFPALSSSSRTDGAHTERLVMRSFRFLVTLSLPAVAGLALVADATVRAIYGPGFSPSSPVLSVLALTLVPVYVATLVNGVLVAADRQVHWTVVMGALCVVNPLLNLLTIPYFHDRGNGAMGAAIALLLTDLITGAAAMILLPGPLRRATYRGLPAMGRSALATAVMVIVVWPLRTQFAVLPILAGVAVYVGVALLLQVFPLEDRALVASLVARGLARMRRRAVATSPEVAA